MPYPIASLSTLSVTLQKELMNTYFVLGVDVTVDPPRFVLMTSHVFYTRREAQDYVNGCSSAWGAFVVQTGDKND